MSSSRASMHRLFILFIILILPIFLFREYRLIRDKKDGTILTEDTFYQLNEKAGSDKQLVVLIPISSDPEIYRRASNSLYAQTYPNFRVVYLGKPDLDAKTRDDILAKPRTRLILEETEAEGMYQAIHASLDDEVIIAMDGDDWFSNNEVLEKINHTYLNQDVWLAYAQYLEYPSFRKGVRDPSTKKPVVPKRVQKAPWMQSPLKSFYAGLFKQVQIASEHEFLAMETFSDLLVPVAELAKSHVRYIPEVLYVHSLKTEEHHMGDYGEGATKSLTHPLSPTTSMVIFSHNNAMQLNMCLERIEKNLPGVDRFTVFYSADLYQEEEYAYLTEKFPKVKFQRSGTEFRRDFLNELDSEYVLLSTDRILVEQQINLPLSINLLNQTRSYAFYFHIGFSPEVPHIFQDKLRGTASQFVQGGIYSWIFMRGNGQFRHPNNLELALYHTTEIKNQLATLSFSNEAELIEAWEQLPLDNRKGLFYANPRTRYFTFR